MEAISVMTSIVLRFSNYDCFVMPVTATFDPPVPRLLAMHINARLRVRAIYAES